MVNAARLEERPVGLTPVSDGWYVTAIRDAPSSGAESTGSVSRRW